MGKVVKGDICRWEEEVREGWGMIERGREREEGRERKGERGRDIERK